MHHAQTLEKHGEAFEKMAGSLEGRLLTKEQAEFIESAGQQIQQHARLIKATAELALENKQYSLEEHALVQQQQHQAVLLHIKAIQVMLQVTQPLI
ncbi:hypothetical protein IFO70_30260 [Phormidium tenue FACHB-886]|nr:hypothetical protein [Phormidium tenue FACHB-886]